MRNITLNTPFARRLKLIERCESWLLLRQRVLWEGVFYSSEEGVYQQIVDAHLIFLLNEDYIHLSLVSFCPSFGPLRRQELIQPSDGARKGLPVLIIEMSIRQSTSEKQRSFLISPQYSRRSSSTPKCPWAMFDYVFG